MAIGPFKGKWEFLSNFHLCRIIVDGVTYRSTEHFYQAQKALSEEDAKSIRDCEKPGQAKRRARALMQAGFTHPQDVWDKKKDRIMRRAQDAKYFTHPLLARKLMDTGSEELIEYNWWHDNHFGHCLCPGCKHKEKKNVLGKQLMQVRLELLADQMWM